MRVLHVYSGNLRGGVESLLTTMAKHSAEIDDLHLEFGLCFDGWLGNAIRDTGRVVHKIAPARFSRPWTVWRARARLGAIIADHGFDVVICHGCWAHALFAPVVRRAGLPLVFWPHDVPHGRNWLERLAKRTRPDLVIANSRFTASSVPHLFPDIPALVVHNSVPPPQPVDVAKVRAEIRQELGAAPEDVVILCVARLHPLKGHRMLLRALARLRRSGWSCWIVGGVQQPGESEYLHELRSLAGVKEIHDRVRFLGQRDDVQCLMAAADIYCQPNIQPETFGNTFVEALYAGLPVVTSSIGGALEIVDTSCGILVAPGDESLLACELQRLIDDAARRQQLCAAGPARAAALSSPLLQLRTLQAHLEQLLLPSPRAMNLVPS